MMRTKNVEAFQNAVLNELNLSLLEKEEIYQELATPEARVNFFNDKFEHLFSDDKKLIYFNFLLELSNLFYTTDKNSEIDFGIFFYEYFLQYEYLFNKEEKVNFLNNILENRLSEYIPFGLKISKEIKSCNDLLELQSLTYLELPNEEELILPVLMAYLKFNRLKNEMLFDIIYGMYNINQNRVKELAYFKLRILFVVDVLRRAELLSGFRNGFSISEKGIILLEINPQKISLLQILKLVMNYPVEEIFRFDE